jgi:BNR/Asp-box repeat
VTATLALIMLVMVPGGGMGIAAQDLPGDSDWALTGLVDAVLRVFAPADGVLFASTAVGAQRSDDGGATWSAVPLPTGATLAAADPIDHSILYAVGLGGLYKTSDDAATWRLVLAYAPEVGFEITSVAVSAADHHRLYIGVKQAAGISADGRLLRSVDGGLTWGVLEVFHFSLCDWRVSLLQAHPTEANLVARAVFCAAGRTFGAPLEQSTDGGATWAAIFNPDPLAVPSLGYPTRLAGGQGAGPARFVLAADRDPRLGGSSVFRSDDDGASWTEVLAYRGGGLPGFPDGGDPALPNVWIGGLVADPADADRLYVGRQVYPIYPPIQPTSGGVSASLDGGGAWADLGRQDIGAVYDLTLAPAGDVLYAATPQGLWRFDLGSSP